MAPSSFAVPLSRPQRTGALTRAVVQPGGTVHVPAFRVWLPPKGDNDRRWRPPVSRIATNPPVLPVGDFDCPNAHECWSERAAPWSHRAEIGPCSSVAHTSRHQRGTDPAAD